MRCHLLERFSAPVKSASVSTFKRSAVYRYASVHVDESCSPGMLFGPRTFGRDGRGRIHHRYPRQEGFRESNAWQIGNKTIIRGIVTPEERFRVEVIVRSQAPYQLRTSDFLSNADLDDFHLFGAHVTVIWPQLAARCSDTAAPSVWKHQSTRW